MWCCLFFNFTHFVILENLLILDLALSGVKGFEDTDGDNRCVLLLLLLDLSAFLLILLIM